MISGRDDAECCAGGTEIVMRALVRTSQSRGAVSVRSAAKLTVMNRTTLSLASLTTVVVALVAASCGGGSDGPTLSEAGTRGKQISAAQGCAACHGANGEGNSGPKWQGLAGAEVALRDGTTTIADDEYLIRSIKDPGADLLDGFVLQMPRNSLSDSDIADVIAYIKDLSPPPE